ncbi:histidine kinase N-terminal 7TM domain-containing protein [Natronococcus occultus]|uniref:Signal transduction histidine kinase n=1 Tax=Natronococcus occultus SP4 TaxID=694430 RepID=L0K660_9EURY|nr:histidine kinase N-terminal 7TM domain-containing protein [Natronococcus occultus]AGB39618.1 signal transduction histidine kinase [Natronococcus occultus SP4]
MLGVTSWNLVLASHLATALLMVGLGGYVARDHSGKPLGQLFVLMVGALAVWVVGSLARLFTLDPTAYVVLTAVKYFGVTTAPIWFVLFALRYAGHDRFVSRRFAAALLVGPVATVLVVLTTEFHGLFYAEFAVTSVGEHQVLTRDRGAWFWLFAAFGWGLLAAGTVLLLLATIGQPALYQKQSVVIVLGVLVPWIVGLAYVFGDWPHPAIDPTPLGFAVTAVLFVIGVFTTRLIDVVPVARSRLLDALDDGMIVVDADDRLLDANATAQRLFVDDAVGTDVTAALPDGFAVDGGEHVVETETGRRVFRPRSIELTDDLGRNTGRVIYLDDVTDVVERERRSVLQRVLRHNIRNDLNVTVGSLDVLEERVDPAEREYVERARESANRVIELSEKARRFERALDARDGLTTVPAATVVDRVLEELRAEYPRAEITFERSYDSTADTAATVVAEDVLGAAVANLVENAIVHAEVERPSVTVRVVADEDAVRIQVADEGPGIPDTELDALSATDEDPLEHGSGFGLWLVKWTVSLSGGELAFESNEPRGSVVTVTLSATETDD